MCPDFVEKRKCERKGCKLVHVIRAQDHDTTKSAKDDEARMQDGDLFMRDDAAAAEASDHETQADGRAKRKRPLMDTELDEDQLLPDDNDEDEDADADEQVDFTNTEDSRRTKRRKAKAFTQQKDFISFDDEEDEEEEEADDSEMNEGEEGSENEDEDEDEDAEVASVHSEDFELSDARMKRTITTRSLIGRALPDIRRTRMMMMTTTWLIEICEPVFGLECIFAALHFLPSRLRRFVGFDRATTLTTSGARTCVFRIHCEESDCVTFNGTRTELVDVTVMKQRWLVCV